MRIFWRFFCKRYEAHQLIEEAREREAHETERQIQTKIRDDRQAQALLLTLDGLQRAMDPLTVAQVYNNRFCPLISRLPEELLLRVCDFLYYDIAAQLCLGIVSRTFLRLLNAEPIYFGTRTIIRGEIYNLDRAHGCVSSSFYRETAAAAIASAGTIPLSLNSRTTQSFSRYVEEHLSTAVTTAMPVTVSTMLANSPNSHRSIKPDDTV